MRLDAGMSLRAVLANASIEEALAVAEWGPAYTEAKAYRPPTLGEALHPAGTAVDHGPLMRSVDARLADVAGPKAVAALAAAREANAVRVGVEVQGKYLDSVIAGTFTSTTPMAAAIDAHHAEQAARAGLPADTGTGDAPTTADAPATEGVTA